jgi:hypothetical protein
MAQHIAPYLDKLLNAVTLLERWQPPKAATDGAVMRLFVPRRRRLLVNIAQFSNLFLWQVCCAHASSGGARVVKRGYD